MKKYTYFHIYRLELILRHFKAGKISVYESFCEHLHEWGEKPLVVFSIGLWHNIKADHTIWTMSHKDRCQCEKPFFSLDYASISAFSLG